MLLEKKVALAIGKVEDGIGLNLANRKAEKGVRPILMGGIGSISGRLLKKLSVHTTKPMDS